MNESRSIKYDRRRLPKEKRIRRIFGTASYINGQVVKDQSNNMFRCWNCGFICNTDRNKLGDGVGYVIEEVPDFPFILNLGASAYEFPQSNGIQDISLSLESNDTPHLMQLNSDRGPVEPMRNFVTTIISGCPNCGCKNYK